MKPRSASSTPVPSRVFSAAGSLTTVLYSVLYSVAIETAFQPAIREWNSSASQSIVILSWRGQAPSPSTWDTRSRPGGQSVTTRQEVAAKIITSPPSSTRC